MKLKVFNYISVFLLDLEIYNKTKQKFTKFKKVFSDRIALTALTELILHKHAYQSELFNNSLT